MAQVLVGGIVLGVNYLTEGGEDDNCAKLTKIVDGQVAPYGAVTAEGNLTVSILASKWVGSWTCTDGSTLFAKVSISHGTPTAYRCRFESQVPPDFQKTRPYIAAITAGRLLSPNVVTCPTPKWSEEDWKFYRWDLEGRSLVSVTSHNWQTNETVALLQSPDPYYSFESINKAPDFLGSDLGIRTRYAYDMEPYIFANWTRRIWKGRQIWNDEDSRDEADQFLTFVVKARVPSYFEIQPKVSPEGTLTFLPAPLKIGSTEIEVQLFDSGGVNSGVCYAGMDRSAVKRFQVVLIASEILPNLQAVEVIEVDENVKHDNGVIIFHYFGNSFAPPTIPEGDDGNAALTSNVQFEVQVYNAEHFEVTGIPRIDPVGTLTFAPAYGFYGDSIVSFRLVSNIGQEGHFGGLRSTPWSNFTIRVHPVNQPPSFYLRQNRVEVLEDCEQWLQHHFAFNISKGLFPEAFELGIFYADSLYRANEAHQILTFSVEMVEGNLQLFNAISMSPNGTLTFKTSLHQNGYAWIRILLRDDGGTERAHDQDTSKPSFVNIVVFPVNDAPVFSFAESLLLLAPNTTASIRLLEQNNSYWHRALNPPDNSYQFVYNSFWSDFGGSFQGPANELHQRVSFTLETITGSSIAFESPPAFSMNGSLTLHIGAYSWGETVLGFRAHDDGGTDFGGEDSSHVLQNITLRIQPVNTRPTIGLPANIYVWVEPYARANVTHETLFMVGDSCCSPCPGPHPCSLEHDMLQSNGCFASDELGTLYLETPSLNSSAGPYEDQVQNLTFKIQEVGDSGVLDTQTPLHITRDGVLFFRVLPSKVGVVDLDITAVDDGNMSNLPQQTASNTTSQNTRLHVLGGFVPVTVQIDPLVFQDVGMLRIRREIAQQAGADHLGLVVAQAMRSVLFEFNGSLSLSWSNPGACSACSPGTFAESCNSSCSLSSCNYHGRCSGSTGACLCFSGWSGQRCEIGPNGLVHENVCLSCQQAILVDLDVLGTTSDDLFALQTKLRNRSSVLHKNSSDWAHQMLVNMVVGDVQSRSINQFKPKAPRFDLPSVVFVDEDTSMVKDIMTNIEVDNALWEATGQQKILWSIQLLRTKAPAQLPQWNPSNSEPIVDEAKLALLPVCDPFCRNASLQLFPFPNIHGLVELKIMIESTVGLKTSKTLLVVFRPIPDRPRVINSPLTIQEDGGSCLVEACISLPVTFPIYDYVQDDDEWFYGGNRLQVASPEPSRLNASIEETDVMHIVLQPGLHQHGEFNVSISDKDGLLAIRPLTIIVQHVNHPPYLKHPLPNVTLSEDMASDVLTFSSFFADVDMIDQKDPRAVIDWMNFSVRSLTPRLMEGTARDDSLALQPLPNMHGQSALTLISTDSLGANISEVIHVNVLPVPDRPFVQRSLPQAPNGTLHRPENSSDVRINISFVFGDVDNCSTLIVREHCMGGPDGQDLLVLSVNNTRPWKVNASIEGDELLLQFATFEHSHGLDDILVTLIATDSFGLVETFPITIVVEAVNTIPYPVFIPEVFMIENQSPRILHVTTWDEPRGDFDFIDKDSSTNFEGDSLRFQVNTTEPTLMNVTMLTVARNNSYPSLLGAECVFPFTFQGQSYSNCTTAGTGDSGTKGYQARFSWCSLKGGNVSNVTLGLEDGTVAKCHHVIQIALHPGYFGQAEIGVSAFDSYGGIGFGKFDVIVRMVNDPPLFTVPPLFEINSISALTVTETVEVKYFATIVSLGFQASAPVIPSPEDVCRIKPARKRGDCQSLPPCLKVNETNSATVGAASFFVKVSLAFHMTDTFDDEMSYFFRTSVAKAAGVEHEAVHILQVTEGQFNVTVDLEIAAKDSDTADSIVARLSVRNLNQKLQYPLRLGPATRVSLPVVSYNSSTNHGNASCFMRCPYTALTYCSEDQSIGQTVTFVLEQIDGDSDMFRLGPQIKPDGTLLYQLAQSRSGMVTFNATLIDDGGTDHGGINSSTVTFKIHVLNLNNLKPYFEIASRLDLFENSYTNDSWWREPSFAFDISPGAGLNELGQNVTFILQQTGGIPNLLASLPTVSPDGTLLLELSTDLHGTANFSIKLVDDGEANRVDESGWKRSEQNDNTSDVHYFEIRVEQVNNAPVFCLPDYLPLLEGSRKQVPEWIPVSPGASTSNCTSPLFSAYGLERDQNLTFTVFTPEGDLLRDGPSNGLGCAPFDYDHDDVRDDNSGGEHIRETSWFRIDSHGSLDVLAATSGQINVTVVLQDDGGFLHGGRDSTTQHLLVQVLIVHVCHPT